MSIGPRVGLAIGPATGQSDPLSDVTYDEAALVSTGSKKYVPVDNEEWTCVATAAGFDDVPDHLYLCQGAVPVLAAVDRIDTRDLTEGGGGGATMTYDHAVPGWSRKSMNLIDGALGNNWFSLAIVDLAVESALLLMYIRLTGAAAATRELAGLGAGDDHRYAAVTSAGKLSALGLGGTASAVGAVDVPADVFPLVVQVDRDAQAFRVISLDEVISPTWTTPTAGGSIFCLGEAINGGAAPCAYLYAALWRGTKAEKSLASIKTLLQTLGWSPTFETP